MPMEIVVRRRKLKQDKNNFHGRFSHRRWEDQNGGTFQRWMDFKKKILKAKLGSLAQIWINIRGLKKKKQA